MSTLRLDTDITKKNIFVSCFSSWAPGLESISDWKEWAKGKRKIEISNKSPALDFKEISRLKLNHKDFMLFKRRLSQISRMTLQVLYDIMTLGVDVKIVFISFRGEIQQQFKINRLHMEEGDMSPAVFSQSVFNTPPALASIAFGLCAGYTAIYPGESSFQTGFFAAASPLLTGESKEIVLVYADEFCPAEYNCQMPCEPLAFAALLQTEGTGIPIPVGSECSGSPELFLRNLYLNGDVQ